MTTSKIFLSASLVALTLFGASGASAGNWADGEEVGVAAASESGSCNGTPGCDQDVCEAQQERARQEVEMAKKRWNEASNNNEPGDVLDFGCGDVSKYFSGSKTLYDGSGIAEQLLSQLQKQACSVVDAEIKKTGITKSVNVDSLLGGSGSSGISVYGLNGKKISTIKASTFIK